MNKNIHIKTARELNELYEHEKAWKRLLLECPGSGPTQSFGWVQAFFKHKLEKNARWICLFAYENQKLVAVYPLIYLRKKRLPGIIMQFFSMPFDSNHTVRADGLILPGYESLLVSLINYLRISLKVFPFIFLKGIPHCSATAKSSDFCKKHISSIKKEAGHEDIIKLKDDFPAYLSGLNSKFRREINRQRRKLEDKYKINYHIREKKANDTDSFETFVEIEDSGWKGDMGTSIKKKSGDYELFEEGVKEFNETGLLEWSFLDADRCKISSQLIININEVLYLWKIGYRENYSIYAPGNLLIYKLLEKSFHDKTISEINFMSERMWLNPWKVQKRKLFNIIIFPKVFLLSDLLKIYYKIKNS